MPSQSQNASPASANEFIERELDTRLKRVEDLFQADAIAFHGLLLFGVDDLIRNEIENRAFSPDKRKKLVVILTTGGGYIEVVQRVVDTLRRYYTLVDFVVPNSAYSAGTVLVMSGDAIHMNYYSRLGPIDPQVETQAGRMVPALGYLERYDRLVKKARRGTISFAEAQLLIDGFDQAELYKYEEARKLSIALLKTWLVKYKFKDWKKTRSRGKTVTKQMKTARAAIIARELNKTQKWHVHGHGISMDVLRKDLKLRIDDYGDTGETCHAIKAYHDLLADYMAKLGTKGSIHTSGSYRPFM